MVQPLGRLVLHWCLGDTYVHVFSGRPEIRSVTRRHEYRHEDSGMFPVEMCIRTQCHVTGLSLMSGLSGN